MIGRERALDRLDRLVRGLDQGGQVVMICGEAGIGKSRLVVETERLIASIHPGAIVMRGSCFQPDRGLPFAPLRDLLRAVLAEQGLEQSWARFEPFASEFVKLLPELADLVPGLSPSPMLAPDQERGRMFQVLSRFFLDCARNGPLLLVVEDLHWCDDTSLDFLASFVRRAAGFPVLTLLTYRSEETTAGLWRLLAGLERERHPAPIELERLSPAQVDAMISAILAHDRPISGLTRNMVASLADGNPFFVEEVLRSLRDAGRVVGPLGPFTELPHEPDIPISVQEGVRRRLADLRPATRDIVSVAAVAGRRFEFPILELVTGRSGDEILAAMRELIDAQFVVEESVDRFAFRHALIRQAIYGRLLLRERRELHLAIGRAFETLHGSRLEAHLGDLAYHMHEAREWGQALEYSLQLGQLAEMHNDPRAAVLHFSRGLHAARELGRPPPADLLLGRGNAYNALGSFDEALADQRAALHAASIDGDWAAQVQAHLGLGMLWAERDYETCGHHYREAHRLALEHDEARLRAACLNRLGNWRLNLEQPEQALEFHQQALLLFRDLGDEAGIAETLDLMGMSANLSGDLIAGTAAFRQAIEIFRNHDDRQGLSSSLTTVSMRGATLQTDTMVVAAEPLSDCIVDASRALDVARDIGWRAGESYALWMAGFGYGGRGDYSDALETAGASLALAREIDHRQWMAAANCALGAIRLDLLEFAPAREHLEAALELAQAINSRHWVRAATGLLASALVQAGDLTQALDVLARELDPEPAKQTLAQRLLWCARAEADMAAGTPARALEIARGIIAASPHGATGVIPRVALLQGRALSALGKPGDARSVLEAALDVAISREAAGLTWRMYLALAEADLADGLREAAEARNAAALEVIERLAARIGSREEGERFLRRAGELVPNVRPLTDLQAAKSAYGGLTARQREVAGLIAHGNSNRTIAEMLSLSDRTVESHVTAILTTLDFSSRSQVAAWAVATGLVDIDLHEPA